MTTNTTPSPTQDVIRELVCDMCGAPLPEDATPFCWVLEPTATPYILPYHFCEAHSKTSNSSPSDSEDMLRMGDVFNTEEEARIALLTLVLTRAS